MCKELWIAAYEQEIEDLAEEHDLDTQEANKMLDNILEKDPHHLDDYMANLIDGAKDIYKENLLREGG